MNDNKQNTALLIVIAVATLLVAVVGATFAYFTASGNNQSTSLVHITGGKMNILFNQDANGKNTTETLELKSDFVPSDVAVATKTFTLTGENTAVGKVTDNSMTKMSMPYTVELEYKNGFQKDQLKYSIKRVESSKDANVTSSVDAGAKEGTFDKTVPGTGEKMEDRVLATTGTKTLYETLVTGNFVADDSAKHSIQFELVITFPDNGSNQDWNKGSEFFGRIVVNRESTAKSNQGTTAVAGA